MLIPQDFYLQNACEVARQLLGAVLVRELDGQRISGLIVETEAYTGTDDRASHASAGRTPRNLPMWEAPGHAYVYLTYGMHWLLNVVCEPEGQPAAVLIRAVEPLEGLNLMAHHRAGVSPKNWTNGPARLTRAFGIGGADNRISMTRRESKLWVEKGNPIADSEISTGPRIGLGKNVPEPWLSLPRRFWITNNRHISR